MSTIRFNYRGLGSKQYVKLLPDTKVPQWDYKCRSLFSHSDGLLDNHGYPQMVPLKSRHGTKLTESWQRYLMDVQCVYYFGIPFDLLSKDRRDRMIRWFSSMYDGNRFITNNAGVDTRENVFTGAHEGAGWPMAQEVVCAVNLLELDSLEPETIAGDLCYRIKTLNGSQHPPNFMRVNYTTSPAYIHVAVTWLYNDDPSITTPEQRFKTGNFPQMENVGFAGHSLYPNISPEGINWVEVSRVELVTSEHINHFEV